MKERPIMFSGEMVRAILDGRKTQTRRVVKPQTLELFEAAIQLGEVTDFFTDAIDVDWAYVGGFCPYGQPGDRLWVRETWADHCAADATCAIHYRAGGCRAMLCADSGAGDPVGLGDELPENPIRPPKWRPSIYMPCWASRLTLEITAVRVERLQDISRGDAMEEGCPFANMAKGDDPRRWYAELWRSLNGPDSWAKNPWVWVIEFRRLAQ